MLTALQVHSMSERGVHLIQDMEPVATVLPLEAANQLRLAALTPTTEWGTSTGAREHAIERAAKSIKETYPNLFRHEA